MHISQHLAEDDPTGHLLAQQPGRWIHIKVPLEAEEDVSYTFPISGRVFQRPKGDVLLPERFTPTVVADLKRKSREWAGQYQQRPAPSSGIIFQPDWWRYYRSSDPLPKFDQIAISVDLPSNLPRTTIAYRFKSGEPSVCDLICWTPKPSISVTRPRKLL